MTKEQYDGSTVGVYLKKDGLPHKEIYLMGKYGELEGIQTRGKPLTYRAIYKRVRLKQLEIMEVSVGGGRPSIFITTPISKKFIS